MATIRDFPQPVTILAADVLPVDGKFLQEVHQGSYTLHRAGGKAAKLEWSTSMLEAFEGSKKQMVHATHLAHLGKKARLALSDDASGTHVGAAYSRRCPQADCSPWDFSPGS